MRNSCLSCGNRFMFDYYLVLQDKTSGSWQWWKSSKQGTVLKYKADLMKEMLASDKMVALNFQNTIDIATSDYDVMKTKWDSCMHDISRFLK